MEINADLVTLAKEDLARRTRVSVTQITVKEIEEVTWPDSSLGCPERGKTYAQVLVPGYRLTLCAGGQDFQYNTDAYKRVIYCP